MPNRIIRESLLDSPRYLSVEPGAQLLYMQLLLLADDFGCLSVEHSFIGRRCFANRPSDDDLDALLEQLAAQDLIRPYAHRNLHFAFIPRFRQRLKRETLKNPRPPDTVLIDDDDAQEKFSKLKNGHMADGRQPDGSPMAAAGRTDSSSSTRSLPKEVKEENLFEEESKSAAASGNRSPVDMAAALAAKMRLKEN